MTGCNTHTFTPERAKLLFISPLGQVYCHATQTPKMILELVRVYGWCNRQIFLFFLAKGQVFERPVTHKYVNLLFILE